MKPARWLAHLPLAILPFLAAAIEGTRLQRAVERRAEAALAAAGEDWAKLLVDGRDVEIRGMAPDQAAVDRARLIAGAAFGVRRVDVHTGTERP